MLSLGVHLDTNGTFGGVLKSQLFILEIVKSSPPYPTVSGPRISLSGVLMSQSHRKKLTEQFRINLGDLDDSTSWALLPT